MIDSDRALPYLLVKHSTGWNVDRCCEWMSATDTPYRWCYPAENEAFPDPRGYAGVIVFGGAPSANDCGEHEWVRRELVFIEACLQAGTPFFGICLGAQMLARVLGATIEAHPEELTEIGFFEVSPTPVGRDFMPKPLTVMQWHREGFTLPAYAERLATSPLFPNQAFQLDAGVVGVQFHPEVNPAALAIWHARNQEHHPGMLDDGERAAMLADARHHDAAISDWLASFLHRWSGAGSVLRAG